MFSKSAERIISFDPAETIEKLLRRTERSVVQLLDAIQQTKAHAKLRVQRLRIVTNNLKAVAFRGAFGSERADQHVPTRLHRTRHLANIRDALFACCKEMKDRAVVPHIVRTEYKIGFRNVTYD
jgi:hypothetical protein